MADFGDDLFSVFEESSGAKVTLTIADDDKSSSKDGEDADSESNDTNKLVKNVHFIPLNVKFIHFIEYYSS
jgi:hypothetical protein